ncbi:MAG: hypothetical protein ACR2QA_17830 [Solirubrobacteraceae bacterium]
MSVVLRVPEELYESARRIAALQGRQAGDLLREAWDLYLNANGEQLAADFEEAAKLIRSGNTAGLSEFAARTTDQRAVAAAAAARAKQQS